MLLILVVAERADEFVVVAYHGTRVPPLVHPRNADVHELHTPDVQALEVESVEREAYLSIDQTSGGSRRP